MIIEISLYHWFVLRTGPAVGNIILRKKEWGEKNTSYRGDPPRGKNNIAQLRNTRAHRNEIGGGLPQ